MRTDVDRIAFTAATTGTVIATVDLNDVDSATFAVAESALGGTVTNHGYDAYLFDGSDALNGVGGDVYGTADLLAAAKKVVFSRYGAAGAAKTTVAPNGQTILGAKKTMKISIWVTGAGGNATGEILIFKQRG